MLESGDNQIKKKVPFRAIVVMNAEGVLAVSAKKATKIGITKRKQHSGSFT
jgi:hypothetical protein